MSLNSKGMLSELVEKSNIGIDTIGFVRSLSDFKFLEELGNGSFSMCRRCLHRESGKQYAVKVCYKK